MLVKIKTWEDMVQEFGIDHNGNIKCEKIFTPSMERYIPKKRIIKIAEDDNMKWVDSFNFKISNDMIEQYILPQKIEDLLQEEVLNTIKNSPKIQNSIIEEFIKQTWGNLMFISLSTEV